jgi:hypothetical protein
VGHYLRVVYGSCSHHSGFSIQRSTVSTQMF